MRRIEQVTLECDNDDCVEEATSIINGFGLWPQTDVVRKVLEIATLDLPGEVADDLADQLQGLGTISTTPA